MQKENQNLKQLSSTQPRSLNKEYSHWQCSRYIALENLWLKILEGPFGILTHAVLNIFNLLCLTSTLDIFGPLTFFQLLHVCLYHPTTYTIPLLVHKTHKLPNFKVARKPNSLGPDDTTHGFSWSALEHHSPQKPWLHLQVVTLLVTDHPYLHPLSWNTAPQYGTKYPIPAIPLVTLIWPIFVVMAKHKKICHLHWP